MKVALESTSLFFKKYTGIPFYIHNLYQAMSTLPKVDVTLAFRLKKKFGKKNAFHRSLLDHSHFWHLGDTRLSLKKFDVAHSLHTPFLNSPSLKVATVHDLAVHLPQFEDHDFATDYFKEKRFKLFQEFHKRADVIITVSETSKRDFLQFFDFPEEKIHSVSLAPSFDLSLPIKEITDTSLENMGLKPQKYFISLGGVSLRKNTMNLVKAYHRSKSKSDYKLVIVGKVEAPHGNEVLEYISTNKLEQNVIVTKYLDDQKLKILYQNASAFLFPTFYEGFGIPILEAMAANLPVLTSTTGAAPETSGGHAILVNPFEPDDIAEGIDKIHEMDIAHLEKAKAFALNHTWRRTATLTTSIYEKYM